MTSIEVYIESGVAMAHQSGVAAWVFEPQVWGVCGQGENEADALWDLRRRLSVNVELEVIERIHGDEQAFERDLVAVTPAERSRTKQILTTTRAATLELVGSIDDAVLDWIDPQ